MHFFHYFILKIYLLDLSNIKIKEDTVLWNSTIVWKFNEKFDFLTLNFEEYLTQERNNLIIKSKNLRHYFKSRWKLMMKHCDLFLKQNQS